jgi:hypothetical protein
MTNERAQTEWTVDTAIEQIEKCGFECQAGFIDNSSAWRWLKEHLRTPSPETPVSGDERIFDLLEPLSKALIEAGGPNIRAGFARATGGVDIPFIVETLTKQTTPSADVSSLERVARAIGEAERQNCGGYPHEGDGANPWLTDKHVLFARAAIAATNTEATIVLKRYREAITSFQRADTEFRRARNAGEQPRLSNAGTRYQCAKWRLFRALKARA